MKLRCLVGLHGPWWTARDDGIGPYSRREVGCRRRCPHCGATWAGQIFDRYFRGQPYRAIGMWERER